MKDILARMLNHEELTRKETKDILVGITKEEFPNEQITALLTGFADARHHGRRVAGIP